MFNELAKADTYDEPDSKYGTQSPIPQGPSNFDMNAAIAQAKASYNPFWFYDQVKNGGPWDIKAHYGRSYEDYGNFLYGILAKAFGFSNFIVQNEAGINQYYGRNKGPASWGVPADKLCYPYGCRAGASMAGKFPFGDDPKDNYWIRRGI